MFCDGHLTVFDFVGKTVETFELPDGQMPVGFITFCAHLYVSKDAYLEHDVGLN